MDGGVENNQDDTEGHDGDKKVEGQSDDCRPVVEKNREANVVVPPRYPFPEYYMPISIYRNNIIPYLGG